MYTGTAKIPYNQMYKRKRSCSCVLCRFVSSASCPVPNPSLHQFILHYIVHSPTFSRAAALITIVTNIMSVQMPVCLSNFQTDSIRQAHPSITTTECNEINLRAKIERTRKTRFKNGMCSKYYTYLMGAKGIKNTTPVAIRRLNPMDNIENTHHLKVNSYLFYVSRSLCRCIWNTNSYTERKFHSSLLLCEL